MGAMLSNQYLWAFINALVLCAALPLIGTIVNVVTDYGIGGLITLITGNPNIYYVFHNYICAPGVVVHELSHTIAAIITLAHIDKVELYKKSDKDSTLGGVEFTTSGGIILSCLQLTVLACAPVITGLEAVYGYYFLITTYELNIFVLILLTYLVICIIIHMTMSPQDIKLYIRGIPLFFLIFFVLSLMVSKGYHQ